MEHDVILVTRFHGPPMALNSDLIERAEATPDTVLTLVDGTKFVVNESVEEIIEKVREFRASIMALAGHLDVRFQERPNALLRVVPDPAEGV